MDTRIKLHQQLTAVLATRQIPGALPVAAGMTQALSPPLDDLYRAPLQDGIDAVPQLDREALVAWISEILAEVETAVLSGVLVTYGVRAFNAGGAAALNALSLPGRFALRNPALLGSIDDFAAMLSDINGDISLLRTTANELGYAIDYGRQQEMAGSELERWLGLYIAGRVLYRSRNIGENETVRWSRQAQAETYGRNEVEYMIYHVHPELSQSGPCPICSPYDGQRFPVGGAGEFLIPQHNGCVCDWDPDLSGWTAPEEVWTGG